jgi:hypothetical protein
MAVFRQYGRMESDQGVFLKLCNDPDSGEEVFLRIRNVPQTVMQDIEAKFGFEKDVHSEVETDEGKKVSALFRQRVHSSDDIFAISREKAIKAWVDSKGLKYVPEDEDAATRVSKFLGITVEAKEEVCLDSRLSPEMKHYLLKDNFPLVQWIVERAAELKKQQYSKEAALSKA